nr:hypothetical protein [Candidatus Freyarchaeota archaeon]
MVGKDLDKKFDESSLPIKPENISTFFDYDLDPTGIAVILAFWNNPKDPVVLKEELQSIQTVNLRYEEEKKIFRVSLLPSGKDYHYYFDLSFEDDKGKVDVERLTAICEWLIRLVRLTNLRVYHIIKTSEDEVIYTKNIFDFKKVDYLKDIQKKLNELLVDAR